MTEHGINYDINSLEEMLPIKEGWLERKIIYANLGSERILDFTERQSRYWRA